MYEVKDSNSNAYWFEEPLPVMAFEKARELESQGDAFVRVFEYGKNELISNKEIFQSKKYKNEA